VRSSTSTVRASDAGSASKCTRACASTGWGHAEATRDRAVLRRRRVEAARVEPHLQVGDATKEVGGRRAAVADDGAPRLVRGGGLEQHARDAEGVARGQRKETLVGIRRVREVLRGADAPRIHDHGEHVAEAHAGDDARQARVGGWSTCESLKPRNAMYVSEPSGWKPTCGQSTDNVLNPGIGPESPRSMSS
jgi:hypothetical protein